MPGRSAENAHAWKRRRVGAGILAPLGNPLSDLLVENAHSDDAGLFVDMLAKPVLDQIGRCWRLCPWLRFKGALAGHGRHDVTDGDICESRLAVPGQPMAVWEVDPPVSPLSSV